MLTERTCLFALEWIVPRILIPPVDFRRDDPT
jgi:hypothetical protein